MAVRNEVTPSSSVGRFIYPPAVGANRMLETGGIPQEANASGNAKDMQTWGELPASSEQF